jgi:DNA-binding winged helix-turn-helix (wHTH) protein
MSALRLVRAEDQAQGLRSFETAPTVVGVSWGSSELPSLLGALLTEGVRVEGPFRPVEVTSRNWSARSIALLDLRGDPGIAEDLAGIIPAEAPSVALVRRDLTAIEEAILSGVSAVLAPPISPRIVAAQVRNLARLADVRPGSETLDIGHLQVNPVNYLVTWKGQPVHLSPAQFKILQLLCGRPGQVQTPEDLARVSLGYTLSSQEAGSVVKIHIHRIRAALEAIDPAAALVLQNVRGFGYMIAEGAAARVA